MVDLSKYSSEKLMKANEKELKEILKEYKQEHMPLWKFGLFVSYNAVALAGMYFYAVKLRGKRVTPSLANRSKFTISNLLSQGTKHGVSQNVKKVIMISLYLAGLFAICHNTISFPLLSKLTEIQTTYEAFGLKFDPSYQERLLYNRMRKFDLSEQLINQIKAQLNTQKQQLIQSGGLLPQTIKKIEQAQTLFKLKGPQLY